MYSMYRIRVGTGCSRQNQTKVEKYLVEVWLEFGCVQQAVYVQRYKFKKESNMSYKKSRYKHMFDAKKVYSLSGKKAL